MGISHGAGRVLGPGVTVPVPRCIVYRVPDKHHEIPLFAESAYISVYILPLTVLLLLNSFSRLYTRSISKLYQKMTSLQKRIQRPMHMENITSVCVRMIKCSYWMKLYSCLPPMPLTAPEPQNTDTNGIHATWA